MYTNLKQVTRDKKSLSVMQDGGRHFQASAAGLVFTGNCAATGLALPIYSATAQLFGIWNPSDSGVYAELLNLRMCYVSTTGTSGGFCLGLLRNTGSALATAAPISAFTETIPESGLIGRQKGGNRVRFTASAATVTTGLMVIGRQLGLNQLALTAADTTNPGWSFKEDWDGDLVLEPGHALFVCGNITTASLWAPSLTWRERVAAPWVLVP